MTGIGAFANRISLKSEKDGRYLIQVTPAEDFTPDDGRWTPSGGYKINADIAKVVIAQFDGQPLAIDYEHQTQNSEYNGQPAPAAGWIYGLRWVDGEGLFAEAEFTERARQYIEADEYRYFSPVLSYDDETGVITEFLMGGLTNNPAIHGMQDISRAAALSKFHKPQEPEMDTLTKALAGALGMPEDATEEAIKDAAVAALTANAELKEQLAEAQEAAKEAQAALTAKRPDPAKFAPVEAMQALQTEVAALKSEQHARIVSELVEPALADGRLNESQREWATELGKSNIAALKAYLETAQPIAALTRRQSAGGPTEPANDARKAAEEAHAAYLKRIYTA